MPFLVDAYVLPRTSLAIVAAGSMVAAAAWACGLRPLPRVGGIMIAAVGCVAAAALLAWLFSVNPRLSLAGAYVRYESAPVRLTYLGLFLGGTWLGSARARRWAANAFIVGCSTAAVEALFQWASHAPFRPDGNLGQAGLLGALLAMAVPLSLQAGLRYRPWLLTLPVLCSGLLVSTSRAGWLAGLVGLLAWLGFRAQTAQGRRLIFAMGGVGAVLAVVLLVASPLRTLNSDTGAARVGVWGDALRAAAARPLTGWGEDATGLVFGRYQSADWEPGDTFDRVHDQPLDLLVTQGVLGSLAALFMWGWFWVRAWSRAAAAAGLSVGSETAGLLGAVAAYGVWSLLNFDWAPATGPAYLLAGLGWGGLANSPGPAAAAHDLARWAGRAAASVWLVAGLVLAVSPVVADRRHYSGDNRGAVAADPLKAAYHQALGEQLGVNTAAGLAELRRAFELGDYDYSFNVELGNAALAAGDRALARAAYERADSVYRFDPTARNKLRALGPG